MAEYAIVVIVLFAFVFGIMDFSLFLYAYHFASEAAREATRYAAVRGSTFTTECSSSATPYGCYALNSDIQTYVQSIAPSGIVSTSVTTTTTWPGVLAGATGACTTTANGTTGVDDNPGCLVKVVLSYPFHFIFLPLPLLKSGSATYTVTSTSEVIISQ